MNNPNIEEWEKTLKKIFDEIDDKLENRYGYIYPLHPARRAKGMTSNKASDGLFNIGASFSAGFGSIYGRGWVVDVTMVTLTKVPSIVKDKMYSEVTDELIKQLNKIYPERIIKVKKDGNIFKIFGELGLEYREES